MKVYEIAIIFWIIGCAVVFAQTEKKIAFDCHENFLESGLCPENFCNKTVKCNSRESEIGCMMTCDPKECVEISAQNCPLERCLVLPGCGKEEVCFPKIEREETECGELDYSGEKECCEGFVKRCGVEFLDGSCDMEGKYSMYNAPLCLPCGNNVCNQFENRCNCPEDCAELERTDL